MKSIFILLFSTSLLNFNPIQIATGANTISNAQPAAEITGIHWKLVELNGRVIKTDDPKGYFLELKPENNFKAYAGCNNMSGHYEYRENRIHFMRIVGTMKSCPAFETEEQFKSALESVDNFIQNGKAMQFRRGDVLLAKFEAVSK